MGGQPTKTPGPGREGPYNTPLCPQCFSANIEPKGKMFKCRDCGNIFPEAIVESPPIEVDD
jgi:tRNA(Ile2) C34 agmatinyltransferase TiaS